MRHLYNDDDNPGEIDGNTFTERDHCDAIPASPFLGGDTFHHRIHSPRSNSVVMTKMLKAPGSTFLFDRSRIVLRRSPQLTIRPGQH